MQENLNKSFARRVGKTLSNTQKTLLENTLPHYQFNVESFDGSKPTFLEIGLGMGEHFINLASQNPEAKFIGFEPYLNGVANILQSAEQRKLENIKIWPDDADLVLDKLPQNSIEGIYILFPDPWPKKRHHKKRFFNEIRLKILLKLLKRNGFIIFASDIEDYFEQACEVANMGKLKTEIFDKAPHQEYIETKYNKKAILEGRKAKFLKITKP